LDKALSIQFTILNPQTRIKKQEENFPNNKVKDSHNPKKETKA